MASPRLDRTASRLKELIPEDIQIIIPKTESIEELINLATDVEVIICVHLSREVIQAAKHLKFIQKRGAGVDGIPFDVLDENILVANTSGANPVPLAEGTVALILSLAKQIVHRHNRFQEQNMKRRSGVELRGKKAGIIGLGSIGIEVARLLHAFQMRILALKKHPLKIPETRFNFDFLGGPGDLKYLLQNSDFVIVTVPLTPETRGMIGENELQFMKKTAFIINVARADIIQEEPLYRALKEGWIAGAAIDVWWPPHWWDPTWNFKGIRPEYPIWKLPNVIATPHNIGSTDTPSNAGTHIIADNIHRFIEGLPLINQVDKQLQY